MGLKKLWRNSAALTAVCLYMLAAFIVFSAGVFLDSRIVTGVPVWLKPAKFAISTAIYTGTIAWLLGYITVWPKTVRAASRTLAVAFMVEIAVIDLQAARGTTSHFNNATPFDAAMFSTMGAFILIIWISSVVIWLAVMKQQFADGRWGWFLRMGLLVSLIGSAMGGIMLPPTPQSTREHIGGHTVGAPDGGPGLPGTGWSTQHGDLRIGHFLGLHGVQLIPLLGLLLKKRRVFAITASYLGLMGILAWQALRGQALTSPDSKTLWVFAAWLVMSIAAISIRARNQNLSTLSRFA